MWEDLGRGDFQNWLLRPSCFQSVPTSRGVRELGEGVGGVGVFEFTIPSEQGFPQETTRPIPKLTTWLAKGD